eukprot:3807193-Prymnesium_polylepis.1
MRIACGQAGSGARDRPPCAARTRDHARLCCDWALQIVRSGFSQNVISVAQKQNPQYMSFVTGLSRQRSAAGRHLHEEVAEVEGHRKHWQPQLVCCAAQDAARHRCIGKERLDLF